MKAETFILKWKENDNWQEKKMDRNKFVGIMSGIKVGFDDNNDVSTRLCKIGEEVTILYIDKDRNETRDIPFVLYNTETKKHIMYEISRRHTIMWSILNGLCY